MSFDIREFKTGIKLDIGPAFISPVKDTEDEWGLSSKYNVGMHSGLVAKGFIPAVASMTSASNFSLHCSYKIPVVPPSQTNTMMVIGGKVRFLFKIINNKVVPFVTMPKVGGGILTLESPIHYNLNEFIDVAVGVTQGQFADLFVNNIPVISSEEPVTIDMDGNNGLVEINGVNSSLIRKIYGWDYYIDDFSATPSFQPIEVLMEWSQPGVSTSTSVITPTFPPEYSPQVGDFVVCYKTYAPSGHTLSGPGWYSASPSLPNGGACFLVWRAVNSDDVTTGTLPDLTLSVNTTSNQLHFVAFRGVNYTHPDGPFENPIYRVFPNTNVLFPYISEHPVVTPGGLDIMLISSNYTAFAQPPFNILGSTGHFVRSPSVTPNAASISRHIKFPSTIIPNGTIANTSMSSNGWIRLNGGSDNRAVLRTGLRPTKIYSPTGNTSNISYVGSSFGFGDGLNPGSSFSLPAGTVEGDFVFILATTSSGGFITDPSFKTVYATNQGNTQRLLIGYKIIDSTDGGTITFHTNTISTYIYVYMFTYRGVDKVTPLDNTYGFYTQDYSSTPNFGAAQPYSLLNNSSVLYGIVSTRASGTTVYNPSYITNVNGYNEVGGSMHGSASCFAWHKLNLGGPQASIPTPEWTQIFNVNLYQVALVVTPENAL